MRAKIGRQISMMMAFGFAAMATATAASSLTTVKVEPIVVEAPKKVALNAPGVSAGYYFDAGVGAFEPVRLRSDFLLRSNPSKEKSQRLMNVGEAILSDGVFLTGKTRTTVESNGASNQWVQVYLKDNTAWVHRDAVVGSLPFATAPMKAQVLVPLPPARPVELKTPTTKPNADTKPREPAARVVAPQTAALARPAPAQPKAEPKVEGPACVASYAEFQKNERFKKALAGINPFTNWVGPMGASISMGGAGGAVLHHPFKGAIPLSVQLCLDRQSTPYIGVNGNTVYFDGPGFGSVSIADPDTNQKYNFTRATQ